MNLVSWEHLMPCPTEGLNMPCGANGMTMIRDHESRDRFGGLRGGDGARRRQRRGRASPGRDTSSCLRFAERGGEG